MADSTTSFLIGRSELLAWVTQSHCFLSTGSPNVRREPRAVLGTSVSTARLGGISFTDYLPLVPTETFTKQSKVV
jgi:hypothetical protein